MVCIDVEQSNGTKTPLSNTGLDSQVRGQELQNTPLRVSVDWMQGTIRFATMEQLHEVIHFIEGYTKEAFVLEPGKGRFVGKQWHNTAKGIEGCLILYDTPEDAVSGLGHAFISFTGRVLAGIPVRDVWRLCQGLVCCYCYKHTRFDIALDDYSKSISFEQMDAALSSGSYTGFKKAYALRNYKEGKVDGFTCSFGSRDSLFYGRFYDKSAQTKGDTVEIDAYRLEGEFKDELAQRVVRDWLSIDPEKFEEDSPKVLAAMVVGRISFIERTEDKNVSRAKMLPWWKEFVDMVGRRTRHSIAAIKTSYERKKNWITRSVAPTLTMFLEIMGIRGFEQYINSEVVEAAKRFKDYHRKFVEVHKQTDANYLSSLNSKAWQGMACSYRHAE